MKEILFFITALTASLYVDGRLIKKNTDSTPAIIHVKSTVPSRVPRAISEEDSVTGYSKEYDHSNELSQTNLKKSRISFQPKRIAQENVKISRLPRGSGFSGEHPKKPVEAPKQPKVKTELVKKPIPKFNEIDYDDDFQSKVIRSAAKYAESGEHEDEDFNLDDYDFDINHDEFVGRGKPLEPRLKPKDLHQPRVVETDSETEMIPKIKPPPVIKVQSKVIIPAKPKTVNKRAHAAIKISKKAADKMKEDYYDDVTGTTDRPKNPETKPTRSDVDDDTNEENDESKEYYRKSARSIRSPWVKNSVIYAKIGEKSAGRFSDSLTNLPMFPQAPNKQFVERSVLNNDVIDPLLLKPVL